MNSGPMILFLLSVRLKYWYVAQDGSEDVYKDKAQVTIDGEYCIGISSILGSLAEVVRSFLTNLAYEQTQVMQSGCVVLVVVCIQCSWSHG